MAHKVLTNARVLWDQFDFSGDHNNIVVDYAAEVQDASVFRTGTRKRKGGLKVASINGGGFWDAAVDGIDEELFARVGGGATVVTVSMDGEEGDIAYSVQPVIGSYQLGGDIGAMFPFNMAAEPADGLLLRGTVLQSGAETASGQSASRQLGAVGASQKLYAVLHVLAVSGTNPTLDAVVRSDNNSGMSSPTSRITFAQATDAANRAQWAAPVDGAITDDWWDIDFTIGGTDSPSFTFLVSVAIL